MSVDINHNPGNKTCTVSVTFTPSAQVDKKGLAKNVVENQLLAEAAAQLTVAAQVVLTGTTSAQIDAELAAEKTRLDAGADKKKAAASVSSNAKGT